jgi:hypothetical protein
LCSCVHGGRRPHRAPQSLGWNESPFENVVSKCGGFSNVSENILCALLKFQQPGLVKSIMFLSVEPLEVPAGHQLPAAALLLRFRGPPKAPREATQRMAIRGPGLGQPMPRRLMLRTYVFKLFDKPLHTDRVHRFPKLAQLFIFGVEGRLPGGRVQHTKTHGKSESVPISSKEPSGPAKRVRRVKLAGFLVCALPPLAVGHPCCLFFWPRSWPRVGWTAAHIRGPLVGHRRPINSCEPLAVSAKQSRRVARWAFLKILGLLSFRLIPREARKTI